MRTTALLQRYSRPALMLLIVVTVVAVLTAGCHSSKPEPQSSLVSVTAPSTGTVLRVLVGEGADVEKDSAIIEIAVRAADPSAPKPDESRTSQAAAVRTAQNNLASAQGEADRTAADVRRIEPLVKRGLASQAELDKARAQALDARERLDLARSKEQSAKADQNQASTAAPAESIVTVRVPAAGKVQQLTVQPGQQVVA